MKTMNVNLTDEQVKLIAESTKKYDFANRSEFLRALLRYVYKISPNLVKSAASSPFVIEAKKKLLTLEEIKKKAIPILKKNDVEFAGIFGSYARGEATQESDLDLLIRYKNNEKISLWDLIGLENRLSDTLGIKVQLVTEGAVHPYIKDSIKNDLIVLYGQEPNLH